MSTAELPEAAESARELDTCPFCGTLALAGQSFCAVCGQPGTPLREGSPLAGGYRIVSALSTSSTGAVYQAVEERRKRSVVIKELLPPPGTPAADRAALAARFQQEVKHLVHLKHPCLPEVYAGFAAEGRNYLVMALVAGKTLETALVDRGRGYSERQVREWMSRLAGLLEYFEERRPPFVHGEILPSHLLLGENATPVLVGFGLAPRLGLRGYLELPGQATGRAAAPLKKRGKSGPLPLVDPRDDLYGLGASLHAALTGRDVFAGVDEPDHPFPPVRDWAPRTSVGIAEIVNRAVSADPAVRFPSAVALQAALAPVAAAAQAAGMPAASETRPPARRGLPLPGLLAVLAVLAAVVATVYILFNQPSKTAREPSVRPTAVVRVTAVPALPVPVHTAPLADTFIPPTTLWPVGRRVYRRGGDLWLDNTAGSAPLKATRAAYSTGKDGFDLQAVVRQVRGPADAAYGIVALVQSGSLANNVALLVRGTGAWSLVRTVSGHTAPLIDWRQDPAVRIGHNSPNELGLRLVPARGAAARAFVVTINGRRMAATAPAGNVAAGGRVGIEALAGSLIVCDGFTVAARAKAPPLVEEHFLDNHLGWSSGASAVLSNNLLRLRSQAGQAWGEATTGRYRVMAGSAAVTEEALLGLSSKSTAPGTGGLVFARTAAATPARSGKQPLNEALAAVVDTSGKVAVFGLTPGHSRVLFGPFGSKSVRRGYGLNALRLTVTRTSASLRVRISVNGSKPIQYSSTLPGLQPATGIAVVGRDSTVLASAFRLFS